MEQSSIEDKTKMNVDKTRILEFGKTKHNIKIIVKKKN